MTDFDGLEVDVTAEDIAAARLAGATGAELIERSVHSALDREGVPRAGRTVTVTPETVTVTIETPEAPS